MADRDSRIDTIACQGYLPIESSKLLHRWENGEKVVQYGYKSDGTNHQFIKLSPEIILQDKAIKTQTLITSISFILLIASIS